MNVIYINKCKSSDGQGLILNKVYKVVDERNLVFWLDGYYSWFLKTSFTTIEEYREIQLNQLFK